MKIHLRTFKTNYKSIYNCRNGSQREERRGDKKRKK